MESGGSGLVPSFPMAQFRDVGEIFLASVFPSLKKYIFNSICLYQVTEKQINSLLLPQTPYPAASGCHHSVLGAYELVFVF